MGPQKHVIVRSVESGEIKKSLNSAKKHALVKNKTLPDRGFNESRCNDSTG